MQGDNFILPDRERIPTVFEALALFFIACVGRILSGYLGSFITIVSSYFFYNVKDTTADLITNLIYYMVFIVLPVSAVLKRNHGASEYIRVRPLSGRISVLCVAAACAGVIFVTYLSYLWLMPIQEMGGILSDSGITIPKTAGGMMLYIITSAVIPGICEELLFRGVILSAYEERGSLRAMFITAFMFMCLHGSVSGMASEFVSGLVLGFIVISTDSLFAGMIYHTVHNAVLLLISYAASPQSSDEAEGIYAQIGGISGVIQVFLTAVLFGGLLLFLLMRIDRYRRDRDFGPVPAHKRERQLPELVVLGSCVAVVLMFYAVDVLSLAGVIK